MCSACSLFNNILPPTVLEEKSDLKFFQEGIKPDWDEKETAAGGIWSVPIKRSPEAKDKLEHYWMDVVRRSLALVSLSTNIPLLKLCNRAFACAAH